MDHLHEAKHGKSRTFHPEALKNSSVEAHIAAHQAIIDELKAGNIKPVGEVIVKDGFASDGSGLHSESALTEYAFVHGKPTKDVHV